MSAMRRRRPDGADSRNIFSASSRCMKASDESNSKWPASKMPTTVNCFRRGITPAGVTWPCGAISVTLSPDPRPHAARQLQAQHDIEFACAQVVEAALLDLAGHVRHLGLLFRQHAAHHHAAHGVVARHHRLPGDVGRGALHILVEEGFASPSAASRAARRWRRTPRYAPAPTACGRALPSGNRSSPTARRSARPRPARCRPSK